MGRAGRNRLGTHVIIVLHICFAFSGTFMFFVVMVMNVGGRWEGGEGGIMKPGGGRIPARVAVQLTFVILCVVHDIKVAHFIFTVRTAVGRKRRGKRRGRGRRKERRRKERRRKERGREERRRKEGRRKEKGKEKEGEGEGREEEEGEEEEGEKEKGGKEEERTLIFIL